MGVREKLAEKKGLAVWIGVALLALGLGAMIYQISDMGPAAPKVPTVYYTTDEGKTLFADKADLMPPFDHGGKPAVRAYVFQCSGKQFVGYLERFTEDAKRSMKQLDELVKNAKPGDKPPSNLQQLANARRSGREVKRPGDARWVPAGSGEGGKVMDVQCPPGLAGPVEQVEP